MRILIACGTPIAIAACSRGGGTPVARYRVSAGNANVADPASEDVILTVPRPFSNHNGGQLAFGPGGRVRPLARVLDHGREG